MANGSTIAAVLRAATLQGTSGRCVCTSVCSSGCRRRPARVMRALCRARGGSAVLLRRRVHVPAALASSRVRRTVVTLEHRREILLDALQHEVLFVQLVVAVVA